MTNTPKSDSDSVRKPLTAERLRELVHYDPLTGAMTAIAPRRRVPVGSVLGTINSHGHLVARIDYAIHYVHRLAWLWMTGKWPDALLDHVNGRRADNRWGNLREATYNENARNRAPNVRNGSGVKNVTWFKGSQRWRVIIKANGKEHFIGSYKAKADAIRASRQATLRLHGDFAR